MAIAGKVAITSGGEWSASVAYDKLVVVTYNNDLYLSKKANTGVTPTDTENWQLLIKNVTQEQYESILNGTTPAGDSKKLNGLGSEEFAKSNQFIGGGEWAAMQSAKSGNPNELYRMQLQDGRVNIWKTTDGGKSWTDLGSVSDGGNADTVDGLHASEFVNGVSKYIGSSETILDWALNPNGIYKRFLVQSSGFPSDVPVQIEGFLELLLDEQQRRKSVIFHTWGGKETYRRDIWQTNWKNNWYREDDYLPTTGGTITGQVTIDNGTGLDGGRLTLAGSKTGTLKSPVKIDVYNNRMRFYASAVDGTGLAAKAMKFNTACEVELLDTGNSQKVVTSASAPSDTSALWVDTTNKKVKAYIDGAWTAMA